MRAPQPLDGAVGPAHRGLDAGTALGEPHQLGAGVNRHPVVARGRLQGLEDDLEPVALQGVGEAGVAGQHGVVEHGDGLLRAPLPVVDQRRDQALGGQPLVQAQVVEHLQGGGVDGAGPADLIAHIHQLLDDGHRVAAPGQRQGQDQAHRPGPGHQDRIVGAAQSAGPGSRTAPTQPDVVMSNTTPSGVRYFTS